MLNLNYALTGLAVNGSGGIHIHTGSSCRSATEVGAHLWHHEDGDDPWKSAKYAVSSGSKFFKYSADGELRIECGLEIAEVVNRTVVVHDPDGVKTGCGVLTNNSKRTASLTIHTISVTTLFILMTTLIS